MSNYSNSSFNYDDANTSWAKTFELIPEGSVVLDVGCSSGTFGAELIKKKQCTVDGIEIDDDDLAKAKKNLRKAYKFNIETDELVIDTEYDIIFMGDVVEHLARPAAALHKLRSLLKDDGKLVFSIPNITHISVRLMLLEGKIEYGRTGLLDETHLHFYNRAEIHRVFNEAAFKIVSFDYTVNDMPFDLAKEKLSALGLVATQKFKKLLNSTDAAAYQFIGVAAKSTAKKSQPLPPSSPRNIVGDYIAEMKREYEKAIADLQQHVKNVSEDRDRVALDRDRLQEEMKHPLRRTIKYAKRAKPGKRNN
jgi:2-polyprenyl-3-methyl-5-hydroxy-6-metoxy-1,4-benzoquinol methylase